MTQSSVNFKPYFDGRKTNTSRKNVQQIPSLDLCVWYSCLHPILWRMTYFSDDYLLMTKGSQHLIRHLVERVLLNLTLCLTCVSQKGSTI